MVRQRRRALVLLVAAMAGLAALAAILTATAQAQPARPPATMLDGIAFGHLPAGLGSSSDFDYEFQRVHFVSRVWESPAPTGGWCVDLDVDVMRGARLGTGAQLHDWFLHYQQRPPAEAHYIAVGVHGHPGWLSRDQVFWLQRPGLAVSVQLDGARWSVLDVTQTGWSAYESSS